MIAAASLKRVIAATVVVNVLVTGSLLIAQTCQKRPWWPSVQGTKDQAGNSNYITPDKIEGAAGSPVRPLAIR